MKVTARCRVVASLHRSERRLCHVCPATACCRRGRRRATRLGQRARQGRRQVDGDDAGVQGGGDIPFENTQYRGNIFPGLSWTAGPSGTKSYVVIMQDADAMSRGAPILHWTMVNIPAATDEARCRDDGAARRRAVRPEHSRGESAVHGPAHAGRPEAPLSSPGLRAGHVDAPRTRARPTLDDGAMKDHVLASGESHRPRPDRAAAFPRRMSPCLF